MEYSTVFVALADLDGSTLKVFYQQLFGQTPTVEIPNVYTEFQLSGLRLGLFKPAPGAQSDFMQPLSGGMSFCIEVKDLEQAIVHLTVLGYPPPGEIKRATHGLEIYAYDPYGNRLILHQVTMG